MQTKLVEPGSIRHPAFVERHVLDDPDHRTARSGGKQECKAAGCGAFAFPRGGNFVDGAALKSTAERSIDGPPMSMCSMASPKRTPGFAIVDSNG